MDEPNAAPVVLKLSPDEAALVAAALRQFEPYWPADAGVPSRAELLAGIRTSIEELTGRLASA